MGRSAAIATFRRYDDDTAYDSDIERFMSPEEKKALAAEREYRAVSEGVDEAPVTLEEAKRILSALARNSRDMRVRVAALGRLEALNGWAVGKSSENYDDGVFSIEDLLANRKSAFEEIEKE